MENWIEQKRFSSQKKENFVAPALVFWMLFFFLFSLLSFVLANLFEWSLPLSLFVDSSSHEALLVIAAPCDSFNTKTLLKPRQVSSSMQFNFGQMFCIYSFIPAQCKNKIHTWTLTSVRQFHLKEAIWSLTKGVSKLRKTDIVITLKSGNDKKFENVLALGRWGFIKSPPKPQNLPPSSFFFSVGTFNYSLFQAKTRKISCSEYIY